MKSFLSMNQLVGRLALLAFAGCCHHLAEGKSFAAADATSKTVRLLTVGNSFSANATHYLGELATAAGDKLVHRSIVVGGAPLQLHAEKAQRFERDPADKEGLYSNGRSLKQELQSDRWDFVTIQQASIKSHDVETYRPFAKWLSDYIKQHAPGAELLIHETWEYRVDDPRFSVKDPAPGEPATQDAMYDGLRHSYETIAKELGIRRIPVGDAFHLVNHDAAWGYHPPGTRFDSKSAKPGELPNQMHSLNVGWSWKKQPDGKQKLGMDGHHANTAGEYLGACVWYEFLFGKDVVGNSFVPKGLEADFAKHLQETAHRVVQEANAQAK
jgi:hypothetical protein